MKRIMIIDDDEIVGFCIKTTTKQFNKTCEFKEFKNGLTAYEYLSHSINNKNLLPDIIFLDINMPIMNGLEFLETYSNLYDSLVKRPQLYLLTSSTITSEIERAFNTKMVSQYFEKPLRLEELRMIVNSELV